MELFKSIREYHDHLAGNVNACVQSVTFYLDCINSKRHLNAYVEVYAEESLQRAAELDKKRQAGEKPGLLHGVVIGIKDVICHAGHKVTAASQILDGFTSVYSSTVVQRLLQEDAIIIGSCNCDEFAMGSTNENSVYGAVLNALDETKVPGGSSGGSAVAVQADLCMVSLGSDTGGSVRQPADFCGIIGMKPSYGCISRYGLIAYASSFDQIGIFGKSIEDVTLVLSVISGGDEYDSTAGGKDIMSDKSLAAKHVNKIAVLRNTLNHPALDREIKSNIESLAGLIHNDGCTVSYIDFDLLDFIVPAYYVLTTAEASSNLSRYDGIRYGTRASGSIEDLTKFYTDNRTVGFGAEVKRRIMLGTFVLSAGYYNAYYTKAQQIRQLLLNNTAAIFEEFDAIILPTVPSTAFSLGDMIKDPVAMYLADIYTVYANLTGLPGISIPLFKHSNGMPFGVQIMTNKDNDLPLLEFADRVLTHYKQY